MLTIDVDRVKAGRGLTERAACRRLRAYAAVVPASQAIVELGAFQGRTTAWLALGASEGNGAKVTSIDPWDLGAGDLPDWYAQSEKGYREGGYAEPATLSAFRQHLRDCGVGELVTPVRGYSDTIGAGWQGQPVGLLWHDALHTAEAVTADLEAWAPHLAPRAIVALHDAGNPHLGVVAGAAQVLDRPEFDWEGRRVYRWRKHPDKRGMLVVRRRP